MKEGTTMENETCVTQQPDYAKAERLALGMLEAYEITRPPVPVTWIANKEGLKIFECDFSETENPDADGFILEKTMYINRKYDDRRKVFTVAHELGHWVLKHTHKNEYDKLFRSTVSEKLLSPIEQEANCFAANILIPRKFLFAILDECLTMISDKKLADIFNVSRHFLRIRREFLNL